MTHVYMEYSQRIKNIEEKQKDINEWLHERDSVFAYVATHKQFASIGKMQKALNYYIRKNTDKPIELLTIEDTILFFVGYVKFVSVGEVLKLFSTEEATKIFIDGLYRLKKKGYVVRNSKRNSQGKSYYALTSKGKEAIESMINEKSLIPFSDYNYNNDGQPNHDCLVGTIYTRLLMLDMPFSYTRYYYAKGMKRKEDVYPDARIEILHSSVNKRILYGEGDTGTEDVDVIIEKIGKYYRQYLRKDKNNYVLFAYQDQVSDKGFYTDYLPCLISTEAKQLQIVYKLLKYYGCTLDILITILEEYVDNPSNSRMEFSEDIFREITEESHKFTQYKIMKSLLCAKSARLLLSFEWLNDYDIVLKDTSDIEKIQSLIQYFGKNAVNNSIQCYIDCRKNMEDTRKRRISLVKRIIKRYDRIRDVYYMRDALNSMLSGVETLFVPHCICDAYIPFIMRKESEDIFQQKIKKMLEKQYEQVLSYAQIGAPFLTGRNISDLFMRNCYYYIAADNHPREIYVENISASLSAMIRVTTLINELLGVSVAGRNCTIICMVDSLRDMQAFHKMLTQVNKKYNNVTKFKLPIYYLMYDDIKGGKLRRCDME